MMRGRVPLGECSSVRGMQGWAAGTAGLRRGHSGETTASGMVLRNWTEMTSAQEPFVHYRTWEASQERRCDFFLLQVVLGLRSILTNRLECLNMP
jgi:hypothetical protein